MKHLRSYNESSDFSNIIEDIKDICLDLKDEGFSITGLNSMDLYNAYSGGLLATTLGEKSKFYYGNSFHIEINKFRGESAWNPNPECIFHFDEVYDAISRIIGYMESNGYKTSVYLNSKDIQSSALRTSMNDITTIVNTVRNAGGLEKHGRDNLSGLGFIRYVRLQFKTDI